MSLQKRLLAGASYTAVAQLLSYGIRFGSTLILTRLLAPDLFGLMAIGSTVQYALFLLSDVGLRNSVIQDPRGEDPHFCRVVWVTRIIRGLVVVSGSLVCTGILGYLQHTGQVTPGSTYADTRLLLIIPLLAAGELIYEALSIEVLRAERRVELRPTVNMLLLRQVATTAATVIWSWLDPGVLALCLGAWIGNLLAVVVSYLKFEPRPSLPPWDPPLMLDVILHGRWLLASSVMTFLANAYDKAYLAAKVAPAALGLYGIAATLGTLAAELASRIGSSAVYPALSEVARNSPDRLQHEYYRVRRFFELFGVVAAFVLLAFGKDIIRLLYDSRYQGSGELLRAFGYFLLMIGYMPIQDAILANGRGKLLAGMNLTKAVVLVTMMAVLVPRVGVIGGVYAYVTSTAAGWIYGQWATVRMGLFSWRKELRLLVMIALAVALSAGLNALRR